MPVPAGWGKTWSRLGLHSWEAKHFQKESGVSSKGTGWLWSLMNLKCLTELDIFDLIEKKSTIVWIKKTL